jgi:hypothetical protein
MIDPIRINHADDDDAVRARHARIEARLDELGVDEVRFLQSNGKLPTEWDLIIRAWMAGKKPNPEKAVK